ncbi:SRR1-like protein isoform X3 [Cyrtonyx montezumae]|uniref:SRR1-like protein isoform X3 n=1 Tax=Cyrtonyx montezumae TaxID=9017 RepID=UPI0032DBA092
MAAASRWCAAGGRRRRRRKAEEESGAAVLRRLRDARDELLSSGFWEASAGATQPLLPLRPSLLRAGAGSTGSTRSVSAPRERGKGTPSPSAQFVSTPQPRCPHQEGKHCVNGSPTLFYMVHCGKALYNNLLWRNWSVGALSNMVIIGNSFKGIEERLPSRILERDYSYIAKILEGVEEVVLPTHPRYSDTFNDTSIHWFPAHKLEGLPAEVWEFVEEPTYEECDDLEIIRKGEEGSQHSPATAQL